MSDRGRPASANRAKAQELVNKIVRDISDGSTFTQAVFNDTKYVDWITEALRGAPQRADVDLEKLRDDLVHELSHWVDPDNSLGDAAAAVIEIVQRHYKRSRGSGGEVA